MENKLSARDLMIGDWVYRPDCYDKVVEVRKDSILGSDPLRGLIPIADLQPIPLTAEILEKNGFKYNDIPIVLGWEQYGLTLYKGGNGFLVNCGQNVALILNYVHELQHALRFCGIDKEIVL